MLCHNCNNFIETFMENSSLKNVGKDEFEYPDKSLLKMISET